VGGHDDADRRAALFTRLDGEPAVEEADALLDRLDGGSSPLVDAVVVHFGGELAVGELLDGDADMARPPGHGLVDRLADDLVERGLRFLAQTLAGCDASPDRDPLRLLDLVGECAHGGLAARLAEDERLDREGEVAKLLDGAPLAFYRALDHLRGVLVAAVLDRAERGVVHERQPGHRLDGPVVEEEREAAALVLLSRDELLGQAAALDRARGEVAEHGGPCAVPALECSRACYLDRPERLAADGKRHDELACRFPCLLARWDEPGRARIEEALRLVAGT